MWISLTRSKFANLEVFYQTREVLLDRSVITGNKLEGEVVDMLKCISFDDAERRMSRSGI